MIFCEFYGMWVFEDCGGVFLGLFIVIMWWWYCMVIVSWLDGCILFCDWFEFFVGILMFVVWIVMWVFW